MFPSVPGDPLGATQVRCLKTIASGISLLRQPCQARVLRSLLALGLVEYGGARKLPLEMVRQAYRLTPAGRLMLSRFC